MDNASRKKRKKGRNWYPLCIAFFAGLLIAAIIMIILIGTGRLTFGDTQQPNDSLGQIEVGQTETQALGSDLELQGIGRYAGLYLEDGSDDIVSNIMMVRVKNTGEKDLQLAKLRIKYADFTAEFEITNLPAGRTVVVLEKNRHTYVEQKHVSASLENVVFFQTQMDVFADKFELTGLDGVLNVKNISGSDISGDIYVYYKYFARDELYGGITFRAKINGGLKDGEIRQVSAGHFDPDECIVVNITPGALNDGT